MRFHLTKYIHDIKHQSNRHLFHLTLTYKPYADYSYSPKNTNDFFIHFYTKYFLPFLLNTKNVQRSKYRELQPICLAFLDEHESKVSSQTYLQTSRFSARLHHHAILAIHTDTYDKMQTLIGENTLASNKFSNKVMSSHACNRPAMKPPVPVLLKNHLNLTYERDPIWIQHHHYLIATRNCTWEFQKSFKIISNELLVPITSRSQLLWEWSWCVSWTMTSHDCLRDDCERTWISPQEVNSFSRLFQHHQDFHCYKWFAEVVANNSQMHRSKEASNSFSDWVW